MSNEARKLNSLVKIAGTTPDPQSPPSGLKLTQPTAISAIDVYKSYRKGKHEVPVLRGTSLTASEGEFVAIVGQSGSGKSTLLHLLGTLDKPDRGEIWVGDQCINTLTALARDKIRNQQVGLIFQFYHLLPELSALENVMVPRMIEDNALAFFRNKRRYTERAKCLLNRLGLSHRLTHRPNQLSGGELQRAAIARALIAEPNLLLADEPTGNLDSKNGRDVINALLQLRQDENITIVMVTHDSQIAAMADRTIQLIEGKVRE